MPSGRQLTGIAVSVALLCVAPRPSWAWVGDDEITPDSANVARFGVEQEGEAMLERGAFADAAELYWREGVRLKDPVLVLDSAEALRDGAASERSIEQANAAIERVAPALDMLYFLRDGAASSDWQPIAPEYLDTLITRSEGLIRDAQALIGEIEAEQQAATQAAAAPVEPEKTKRGPAKPGTGLIAAGSAFVVIGVGGAGLGVAGLLLGAAAQAEVEDPLVYQPQHGEAEQRGQTANVLAGVGLGLGGVGVGVGVGLLVVGIKKRKRAGEAAPNTEAAPSAEAALVPMWFGHGGGLGLVGRF
jgi:hypothetical protein